ncbi:MAG TPA: hypothetical protein VLI90_12375 [Tepidisphaeraceae bacterium]|nr:hypothetical protein [Tepidisphaeraceae bacterium]
MGGTFATMLLITIGCTATSKVVFNGLPGAVLFLDGQPHHLPSDVKFTRPASASGSTQHDADLAFTSSQSKEIRATGTLNAFAYTESDFDKVAVATCNLGEEQLVKIPNGTTLIFKGQTANRQALYKLTPKQK